MAGKLGFGCMRLPLLREDDFAAVDTAQVERMVDLFLERGFTYFDTAYMYHDFKSETVMREVLVRRHDRASFTLASKLPTMFLKKEGDQERIFAEQLEKCGVDYFDYYLLHNLNVSHYENVRRFDSFAFARRLKAEGRIRRLGFSFHDRADLLDEILTAHPETEFVQLQINYLDWDNESIQSRKCYEVARRHGKPVVVMEPVKGGTLARLPEEAERLLHEVRPDLSPAAWAIRFAASLEGVMMVLSGMSSLEQLRENTGFMQHFEPLDEREAQRAGMQITHGEYLDALEANLKVFPAETAQVLEYWMDISLVSDWKKPARQLTWHGDVFRSDIATYARLGIRNITAYAIYLDADYVDAFHDVSFVYDYGKVLWEYRPEK